MTGAPPLGWTWVTTLLCEPNTELLLTALMLIHLLSILWIGTAPGGIYFTSINAVKETDWDVSSGPHRLARETKDNQETDKSLSSYRCAVFYTMWSDVLYEGMMSGQRGAKAGIQPGGRWKTWATGPQRPRGGGTCSAYFRRV